MASSSRYSQDEGPPPAYDEPAVTAAHGKGGAKQPLLQGRQGHAPYAQGSSFPSQSWSDQPEEDIDDFEYGTCVSSSSLRVRHQFILKVYSALFCQIAATTAVGAALYMNESAKNYVQTNSYCFWVPTIASLVSMGALFAYRRQHPLNVILLGAFTLAESLSVGTIITFFDAKVVLMAFVITTFLVLGLSLFALQTKYDFSSAGGYIFGALLAFILVGFAQIFFPFSNALDSVYSGVGVLLFSFLLIYDTQMIMNRLAHDEWVLGVVSLYLDVINIFLHVLRLLNSTSSDN